MFTYTIFSVGAMASYMKYPKGAINHKVSAISEPSNH